MCQDSVENVTLIDDAIREYSRASELLKPLIEECLQNGPIESTCRPKFMKKLARLMSLLKKLHVRINEFPDPDRIVLWQISGVAATKQDISAALNFIPGLRKDISSSELFERFEDRCGEVLEELEKIRNTPGPNWSGQRLCPHKPNWVRSEGQLWYDKEVVKTVKSVSRAKHVTCVLDVFQELKWATQIDDPLPDGRNQTRLHTTIKSLNEDLSRIRFSSDGTGEGFRWHPESST